LGITLKKFLSVAAAAAALIGLVGAAPAQAAAPTCHGSKPTILVNVAKSGPFEIGTDGPDVILLTGTAKEGAFEVFAGKGDDLICNASTGRAIIFGAAGNDTFYGSARDDIFYGGYGNDHAWGGVGRETIYGGPGNDWLEGGDGSDFVSGGAGNDIVYGNYGADTVIGGAGKDVMGIGNGLYDDNAVDRYYGPASEIPKGHLNKSDINYVQQSALDTLNRDTYNNLLSKYKDTGMFNLSKGPYVIDGETFPKCLLVSLRNSSHWAVTFWTVS
jgi:hypothetical protein